MLKIIKKFIERDFSNPMGWSGYYDSELKELQQAIKHLIKAYKELEYKYNRALSDLAQAEHKNKELEEENQQIETIKDEAIRRYNFESIPVSLVEETIEELKKQYEFYNSDKRETKNIAKGYYIAIQRLQELLEKRK